VRKPGALLITINFRQANCTLELLNSLFLLEQFADSHLIIVDNNSDDGSALRLGQALCGRDNVELAVSPRNRGYFGGASWAFDRYLTDHCLPPWVIVCNNDIVFDDPQFLRKLIDIDPMTVGVLAPSIISRLTAHDANPSIEERPSAFRMLRYRIWFSSYYAMWIKQWLWPFVRKARKELRGRQPVSGSSLKREIYAPHGACFIFSRQFFEAGGFIDDGTFLYGEEFLVAEMCRHLCLPVVHDPALRVWHAEGRTSGRMLTREIFQHQKNGFRYALSRYKCSYHELVTPRSGIETQAVAESGTARSLPAVGGPVP
jgi:GT2 family glycosyltransferase